MPIGGQVKDETLVQKVTLQLSKRGIRVPCRVNVTARNGDVTLSGTVQFELQRKTALHAAREVQGVGRVRDNLQVTPPTAAWQREKQRASHPAPPPRGTVPRSGEPGAGTAGGEAEQENPKDVEEDPRRALPSAPRSILPPQ